MGAFLDLFKHKNRDNGSPKANQNLTIAQPTRKDSALILSSASRPTRTGFGPRNAGFRKDVSPARNGKGASVIANEVEYAWVPHGPRVLQRVASKSKPDRREVRWSLEDGIMNMSLGNTSYENVTGTVPVQPQAHKDEASRPSIHNRAQSTPAQHTARPLGGGGDVQVRPAWIKAPSLPTRHSWAEPNSNKTNGNSTGSDFSKLSTHSSSHGMSLYPQALSHGKRPLPQPPPASFETIQPFRQAFHTPPRVVSNPPVPGAFPSSILVDVGVTPQSNAFKSSRAKNVPPLLNDSHSVRQNLKGAVGNVAPSSFAPQSTLRHHPTLHEGVQNVPPPRGAQLNGDDANRCRSATSEENLLLKNQCHGTTNTGKRCSRVVIDSPAVEGRESSSPARSNKAKAIGGLQTSPSSIKSSTSSIAQPSLLDVLDLIISQNENGDQDKEGIVKFCFQHQTQVMKNSGCFVNGKTRRGIWIEYDEWILPDLPMTTKVLLRHEMAQSVSIKDTLGYIYVLEMVECRGVRSSSYNNLRTTYLKLGRSKQPVARLSQWRSQCKSREPVVRDFFPRANSPGSGGLVERGVGIGGALNVAPKGLPNHHRWERLVLIEVAGRVAANMGHSNQVRTPCRDCGKTHVELFEVEEDAYESWVKEIVERWGRWCADVLG